MPYFAITISLSFAITPKRIPMWCSVVPNKIFNDMEFMLTLIYEKSQNLNYHNSYNEF